MKFNLDRMGFGRRALVISALLLGGLAFFIQGGRTDPAEKEGFVLISQADLDRWAQENLDQNITEEEEPEFFADDRFHPVEDAPLIIVLQPGAMDTEGHGLPAPIDFIMRFEPQGEAKIDLDSIKISYKMLIWKDVTKRILEHADITEEGFEALGADIPTGKHKMRLEVKDTFGRKARTQITFRITSKNPTGS